MKFDPQQQFQLNSMPAPPPVRAGDTYWLEHFWRLSTCRQCGFGEGPIPFTAVLTYSNMLSLHGDDASEFEEVILSLDREYLTIRSEQSKEK